MHELYKKTKQNKETRKMDKKSVEEGKSLHNKEFLEKIHLLGVIIMTAPGPSCLVSEIPSRLL